MHNENRNIRFGTNSIDRVVINNAGNVGIGTTNPQSLLHMHRNTVGDTRIQITNTSAGSTINDGLVMGIDSTNNSYLINQEPTRNFAIGTGAANATQIYLSSTGNVGIGSTNPVNALTVNGNVNISGTLTAGTITGGGSSGTGISSAAGVLIQTTSPANIALNTNNQNRMIITGDGNIGIGITTPTKSSFVHINSPLVDNVNILFTDINNNINNNFILPIYGGNYNISKVLNSTGEYSYISFLSGTTTIYISQSMVVDIFMIGGGGAGAYNTGGAGGSGAAIIAINQTIPSGSYVVTVGAGGVITTTNGANGGDGGDSSIGSLYVAKGGGGGGYGSGSPSVTGSVGGSSGGAGAIQGNPAGGLTSPNPSSANVVGGTTGISPTTTSTYVVLGNKGGNTVPWSTANYYDMVNGGGGGGIGAAGTNGTNSSPGTGGAGAYQVLINGAYYNFKNHFCGDTNFGVDIGTGDCYIVAAVVVVVLKVVVVPR
jgi:hypothetical protein